MPLLAVPGLLRRFFSGEGTGILTGELKIPRHLAIIMDGNGRWAEKHGLPRTAGHRKGMEQVREIIEECGRLGVEYLTLYVFSTENWKRPPEEVSFLMQLLEESLETEVEKMAEKGARVRFIGLRDRLSPRLVAKLEAAEKKTAGNQGLVVNLALNYGGRAEIVSALRKIAEEITSGQASAGDLDEALVEKYLFTAGQPDPDLIIRTSGEQRLSNFLLWQAAYSEFIFTPVLWPDFGRRELHNALREYAGRKRRFGGLNQSGSEK